MENLGFWYDKLIAVCSDQKFDDTCIRLLLYITANSMSNNDKKILTSKDEILKTFGISVDICQAALDVLLKNNIIKKRRTKATMKFFV